MKISKTDAAYIAGIIDGEGSIMVIRRNLGNKIRHSPKLVISNTNEKLLKWLTEKLGGRYHLSRKEKEVHKQSYAWHYESFDGIKSILKVISPYLIIKKKQALLMLDFIAFKSSTSGISSILANERKKIYNEMRVLNKRGEVV